MPELKRAIHLVRRMANIVGEQSLHCFTYAVEDHHSPATNARPPLKLNNKYNANYF